MFRLITLKAFEKKFKNVVNDNLLLNTSLYPNVFHYILMLRKFRLTETKPQANIPYPNSDICKFMLLF